MVPRQDLTTNNFIGDVMIDSFGEGPICVSAVRRGMPGEGIILLYPLLFQTDGVYNRWNKYQNIFTLAFRDKIYLQ